MKSKALGTKLRGFLLTLNGLVASHANQDVPGGKWGSARNWWTWLNCLERMEVDKNTEGADQIKCNNQTRDDMEQEQSQPLSTGKVGNLT